MTEEIKQFIKDVDEMRRLQTMYFSSRNKLPQAKQLDILKAAKMQEKKVDQLLRQLSDQIN